VYVCTYSSHGASQTETSGFPVTEPLLMLGMA
jgi:hypothetical protein